MATVTIPKNLMRENDLIAVPYSEDECFLAFSFPRKEIALSLSQKETIAICAQKS